LKWIAIALSLSFLLTSLLYFAWTSSSSFLIHENGLDEETAVISMEQIIKRHPYKFVEPSNGKKVVFNNKFSQKAIKTLDSWKEIPSRELDESNPTVPLSSFSIIEQSLSPEDGNILFFSFHGKVNNGLIMHTIASQHPQLFVDGGDLLLHQYLTHNSTIEDKWASYDPQELTGFNKIAITEYIESLFRGYGGTQGEKRKMLSVHMTDAWEGGVDISWLISEFQRVGRVTHMIIITRNPLRAKISGWAPVRPHTHSLSLFPDLSLSPDLSLTLLTSHRRCGRD
jgi:hypothetical protein